MKITAKLFLKLVAFWVAVLCGLAVLTVLIPGGNSLPEAAMVGIILAIALAQIWYLKRKQRRA